MMKRLIAKALAFGMLAGLFLFGAASPAAADPDFIWLPDKGNHSWCYNSGFVNTKVADYAMTWLRNQTVVNTAYPGACTARTDVRWGHTSKSGVYGLVDCKHINSVGNCDSAYIRLNRAIINDAPNPGAQRRKTSCHELGHTVGVRHYGGSTGISNPDGNTHSCMRSGAARGETWNTRYGNHHKSQHINPYFS